MSNFGFLQSKFNALYPSVKQVEPLVISDPRGSCFYARLTLELAVNWLYEHDRSLRRPYQQTLGALIASMFDSFHIVISYTPAHWRKSIVS